VALDMSLVQRGARNRRTPYYEATQKYDPKGFTVYNHMYFPIRFDTFEAEYDALLNRVTLWDVAVERQVERRLHPADHRRHCVTRPRLVGCHVPQHLDARCRQSHLLGGLAQGRRRG